VAALWGLPASSTLWSLFAADPALADIPFTLPMSEAYHDENIPAVRNFTPWVTVAVLLCVAAYYVPIHDIVKNGEITKPGFTSDNPSAVQTLH